MNTATTLRLRAIVPSDAAGLVALARATFNTSWTEAFISWKYFRNPAGDAVGACAEIGGRVVASFSHVPVRLKLGSATTLAMQAVDAMVLAEYRRQKLFLQLAQHTYQRIDAAGSSLSYVFPAAAVRTPFIGQFAYVDVGRMPRFVKFVRAADLGKSLGRPGPKSWLDRLAWEGVRAPRVVLRPAPAKTGLRVHETRQFDERFDLLWQQLSGRLPVTAIRDAGYLTWRYQQNPLHNYLIMTAERDEQLAGYVIVSIDPNQPAAFILEFMVSDGDDAAGFWLLTEAANSARQAGYAQLQCGMMLGHRFYVKLLERSGFVYWPNRLMPGWLGYTTPFIVRQSPGSPPAIGATSPANWFLSLGDHDYY